MAKAAGRSVELEPIDRLEEKLKLLVAMVDRMKTEQARAAEENQRLSRELDVMRARAEGNIVPAMRSSPSICLLPTRAPSLPPGAPACAWKTQCRHQARASAV